jgi:hypothetical protein
MWLMDSGCSRHMTRVTIWFSNLTPKLFMCLILVGLCFLSFSVLDSFGGHSFSHSMNTHESNLRFHLIDGFLDSLSCGLGRVHGHASRASFVGPWLCPCDASIGSSHVVSLSASHHFCSNKHTCSFP